VLPHLQVVAAGFGGSPEPRARRGHAGASAVLAAGAATQICDLEPGSFPIAVNRPAGASDRKSQEKIPQRIDSPKDHATDKDGG
jgi:hypothetical protein